ncbi:MAG: hypothetical protein J6R22_02035 [Alphaproteobacteria bacterium]|nr:hypothetical protein [Alphaproteobacteria bacterium]
MVNVNEVIGVDGINIIPNRNDWYAVDVFIKRGETVLKIVYPYKNRETAQDLMDKIKRKENKLPEPAYKPLVYIMNAGKVL